MNSKTGRPRSRLGLGEQKIAYLFILPPLVLFLIFMVIPTVMALYLSLTNYNVIQAPKFVGVRNFVNIVHDPYFFVALRNTFYYVVIYVPLGLLTALGAAIVQGHLYTLSSGAAPAEAAYDFLQCEKPLGKRYRSDDRPVQPGLEKRSRRDGGSEHAAERPDASGSSRNAAGGALP